MTIIRKTLAEIAAGSPLSDERIAEIAAMPDEDIDTSDIPELDEQFWQRAELRQPGADIQQLVEIYMERHKQELLPIVVGRLLYQMVALGKGKAGCLWAAYEAGKMASKAEANKPVANRLGMHAMYGNHTFHKFTHVTSPDDLTHQWIAMGGGRENDITLCPVAVLNGKQELRRVGRMLFDANEVEKVEAFKAALLSDPDVVRLMAQQKEAGE